MAADNIEDLTESQLVVLSAFHRAVPSMKDASLEEIKNYVARLDPGQTSGLISTVKCTLHEMEFVRLENQDGDCVYASYYKERNHPDTDITLHDQASGETFDIQLKATNDSTYVQDWIEKHPDGEILVTHELAERMNLPTTEQFNQELTANVESFLDKLVASSHCDGIWDYIPAIGTASVGVAVHSLWKRRETGELSKDEFNRLAAKMTGVKVAKVSTIAVLLSTPVLGQVAVS